MTRDRKERLEEKRRELSIQKANRAVKLSPLVEESTVLPAVSTVLESINSEYHNRRKRVEFSEDRTEVLLEILAMAFHDQITHGQLIRMMRRDVLGYSQDQFVQLTKVNRKTLSLVEGDKTIPSLSVLLELLKPFGLELTVTPKAEGMKKRLVDRLKTTNDG